MEKLLQAKQPELCYKCHDKKSFTGGKYGHKPVAGGRCTTCHKAHNAKSRYLLTKATPGLCFECHMNEELMGREKHGPFKIGMCNSCHSSHQSQTQKLLIGKSPDLCYTCHSMEGFAGKYVHKPVADGKCFDCHGNHTSPFKGLSKIEGNEMCRKCHSSAFNGQHPNTPLPGDVKVKSKGGKSGHPVDKVDDPKRANRTMACVSCHNAHSSDWKGLFRYKAEKPADLCQHCHR